MTALLSALPPAGKLAAVAALFLLAACGGQAEEGALVPTCGFHDVPAIETAEEPPVPVDLGFEGQSDDASVDKDFYLSWTANGGGKYWIPDWYGYYVSPGTGLGMRCAAGVANWTANCAVPRDRVVKFNIDMSLCDSISQQYGGWQYSAEIMNAFADWYDFAETEVGWDIEAGSTGYQVVMDCQDRFGAPANQMGSFGPASGTSCRDLSPLGGPRDLCFQPTSTHVLQIHLDHILAYVNQSFHHDHEKLVFIYNHVWHELMHSVGIGHVNDNTRLMNPTAPQSYYTYFHYPMPEEIGALVNFNPQHTLRCKWQPGDAVGNLCPHESAGP